MNYYIQGDATNADKIRAAFKRLGYDISWPEGCANPDVINIGVERNGAKYVVAETPEYIKDIIKTHPDYKELELSIKPKFKVGDLVYIHEPECKGHRIDAIDELDGQVGADGEVYDECDIRPIPITKDILMKNGLQKLNDKTFLLKNQIEIEVGPTFSEVSARYEVHDRMWDSYSNCYIEIAIIHYVHELQHLLRLMGVEKEIEL